MNQAKIIYFTTNQGTRRSFDNAKALGVELWYSSVKFKKNIVSKLLFYLVYFLHDTIKFIFSRYNFVILELGGYNLFILVMYNIFIIIFKIKKVNYAVDSHSFVSMEYIKKSDKNFLLRKLFYNSKFLILHNNEFKVSFSDFNYIILESKIPEFQNMDVGIEKKIRKKEKNIVFITKFHDDEPIDIMLKATKYFNSNYHFYFTGDYTLMDIIPLKAKNITFTSFLPFEKYKKLLNKADVLVAITTREKTLLYSGREALALEKPMVLSNNPTNMAFYRNTAIFTEVKPEAIYKSILTAIKKSDELISNIPTFKKEKLKIYNRKIKQVLNLINGKE